MALDCRPPSLEEIFLRHYGPDQSDDTQIEDDATGADTDTGSDHPAADLTDGASSAEGNGHEENGHEHKVTS